MANSTLLKSGETFDPVTSTAVKTPDNIFDSMAGIIGTDESGVAITLGDLGIAAGIDPGSQDMTSRGLLVGYSVGVRETKSNGNAAFTASATDPATDENGPAPATTVATAGYNANTGVLDFGDAGSEFFATTSGAANSGAVDSFGGAAAVAADTAASLTGDADGSANGVGGAISALAPSIPPVTNASFYPNGATGAQLLAAVNLTGPTATKYTGSGVKIGVLSDSFNFLGNASADYGTALPAGGVKVLQDLPHGRYSGTDEGRAMLQIVHAIAPSASLYFATGDYSKASGYTDQGFADNILALAAAGCKVICDDLTFFNEPFFQTGVIAQAIETVEAQGVIYLSSAGNQAAAAFQAAWSPIASATFDTVKMTDAANLNPGHVSNQEIQTITNNSGLNDVLLLQWNDPYPDPTNPNPPPTATELGMLVFTGGNLVQAWTNGPSGTYGYGFTFTQQNWEGSSAFPDIFAQLASGATYQIAIVNLSGADPGVIKDVFYNDTEPSAVSMDDANAGTVFGHHMDPDQIAIGAVDSANTPGNGVINPVSEAFSSSEANTTLYFDASGNEVNGTTGEALSPIGLSGVDDIQTTLSFSSGLGDFFGTSAATPSVAAVVADMLQKNPTLTLAQVENILESTATSFGNSNVAGAGLVNADNALAATACYCRGTPILTPDGDRPVEDLLIGDRVVTISGEARPIKWVGRRAYDPRFVADNRSVLPVRIAAGALGDGLPRRDLWLSPEHALFIDGALVAARLLVNGTTIVQAERVDSLEYFHIELDTHDIMLAEGMPAESYVECDNRGMFQNADEFAALYPADTASPARFCAPRLEAGAAELVAIDAAVARRAAAMGYGQASPERQPMRA